MILIKDKYLETSKHIRETNQLENTPFKLVEFQSYDKQRVQKQIDEFLDDHIFLDCYYEEIREDTSSLWQLSNEVPLILHYVTLLYYDWPF